MKKERIAALLLLVLVVFSLYTGWVVWRIGYLAVFSQAFATPGSLQVYVDLALSCTLILVAIFVDMRRRGLPVAYFIAIAVLTLALGTVGSLVYLIERTLRAAPAPPANVDSR